MDLEFQLDTSAAGRPPRLQPGPLEVLLSPQELDLIWASVSGMRAAASLLAQLQAQQAGLSAPDQPELMIDATTRAGICQAIGVMNALLSRTLDQAQDRAGLAAAACRPR